MTQDGKGKGCLCARVGYGRKQVAPVDRPSQRPAKGETTEGCAEAQTCEDAGCEEIETPQHHPPERERNILNWEEVRERAK